MALTFQPRVKTIPDAFVKNPLYRSHANAQRIRNEGIDTPITVPVRIYRPIKIMCPLPTLFGVFATFDTVLKLRPFIVFK